MRNINFGALPPIYNTYKPIETLGLGKDKVVKSSEMDQLLKLVYAPDKRTHLPSGDLQVLASDSVNPQIADWVRKQLLQPVNDNSISSSIAGQQIDDDTLLALTRNYGESSDSYINRCNNLLREWNKAMKEEISLNCSAQCQGCGAAKYGVGICTQKKGDN